MAVAACMCLRLLGPIALVWGWTPVRSSCEANHLVHGMYGLRHLVLHQLDTCMPPVGFADKLVGLLASHALMLPW